MSFSCPCGVRLKKPKMPVYCRCGRVHGKAAKPFVSSGTLAWDKIHAYPVTVPVWNPDAARQWYEQWVTEIPPGCGCGEKWRKLTERWKPDFSSREAFFSWGHDRHNDVNQELGRPGVSLEFAKIEHGWQQPQITSFIAVTSVSPLPKHQQNQPRVFDSWKRFGLKIRAVNRSDEIEKLALLYPQIDEWVACDELVPHYSFHTQRINRLVDQVADGPILLINSDIEIRGDQKRLLSILASGSVGVGIRYNYTGHWRSGQREGWGIDAFLMTPEQAQTLPQLDFCIGRPMWDYWLPYHFDAQQIAMEWIGEPYFYHEAHPVHWSNADLDLGRKWIAKQYGRPENWEDVRRQWPFAG